MTYVSDADVKAGKYRGVEKLKRTTVVLSSVDSSTDNRYINFAAGQRPKGVDVGLYCYMETSTGGYVKLAITSVDVGVLTFNNSKLF